MIWSSVRNVSLMVLAGAQLVSSQAITELPDPESSDVSSGGTTEIVVSSTDIIEPTDISEPLKPSAGTTESSEPADTVGQKPTDTDVVESTVTVTTETDTGSATSTFTSSGELETVTESTNTTVSGTLSSDVIPTPTDLSDDETDIVPVPSTYGGESKEPNPTSDVTSEKEHEAEYEANMPEKNPSEQDAKELAVNDAVIFNYFVKNEPSPGDAGNYSIPSNISDCALDLNKRWLGERSLTCSWITRLDFDVYFHYILPSFDSKYPARITTRVKESVDYMNFIYQPNGINFRFQGYQQWRPPKSGSNSDWSETEKLSNRLKNWQKQTRRGNRMTLNVWLINEFTKTSLQGYARFPWYDEPAHLDGVVMRQAKAQGIGSLTLIHEIGHWLGLKHTFGTMVDKAEDDCKVDDGLVQTTQTRGYSKKIHDCEQIPCQGTEKEYIYNFMSYSVCRGRFPVAGILTDQKTAIFSRVIKWRRGYNPEKECWVKDPDAFERSRNKKSAPSKRSTMQDVLDGQCPDIKKGAKQITDSPTSMGAKLGGRYLGLEVVCLLFTVILGIVVL